MPSVTFDGQSFLVDNRRVWIVGAGLEYARVPEDLWSERIAAVKQAGFNTISTSCPWVVHEPRRDRFVYSGQADVRRFVELCAEAGMHVILKPGPFVGDSYDGGGLPPWLAEHPGVRLRESNEFFLERIGTYFRSLFSHLSDLQATKNRQAPILLVQNEAGWCCSNPAQANEYLREVNRHIRENGMSVPIISANDLWIEADGTIETWTGETGLLANLRQLGTIQPNTPRIVSAFPPTQPDIWGEAQEDIRSPNLVLHRMAQILAAGAQPVVTPFHAGTNFAFQGGRLAGRDDGFVTTCVASAAPLGEAGHRTPKYTALKRLATFATHFGSVFAELDPGYQPATLDLESLAGSRNAGVSVVPLLGDRGRISFVFNDANSTGTSTTLLLDDGLAMPVDLGDQPVGWYLAGTDLGGSGRLDYANLCPYALVDRTILVLFGAEKSVGYISINGSLAEVTVPSGQKPHVEKHQDITLVVCNQSQIDVTYTDQSHVYVGCAGLTPTGEPIPAHGYATVSVISRNAQVETVKPGNAGRNPPAIKLEEWTASPAVMQASGTSPRYATLEGPVSLDACGTPFGYGWYRVSIKSNSSRKRLCMIPGMCNRMHMFVDGELQAIVGPGIGATNGPFELRIGKNQPTIVGLADHTGRFSEGNDLAMRKGWLTHLYEVKQIKTGKPRTVKLPPVDPFALRGFIYGLSKGRLSSPEQLVWSFTHRKKSPVIIAIDHAMVSGTFLLNDVPLTYFSGMTGSPSAQILIDPALEHFKRGSNELRFAADHHQGDALEAMAAAFSLYECVEAVTEGGSWGFARWEPPMTKYFEEVSKTASKSFRGRPAWWRTTFVARDATTPMWFDMEGLSKGQVFVNGHNLGRYFTAGADGRKVGPQRRLYVPEPWIKHGEENELILFDEHGFDPFKTQLLYRAAGDMP